MLEKVFNIVRDRLYRYFEAREELIKMSREIVRSSREAIQLIHKGLFNEARKLIISARNILRSIALERLSDPRLKYSGFWIDVTKEFVEAYLLFIFMDHITGNKEEIEIPFPEELDVSEESWVLGLSETAGELKREMLLLIERNDFDRAKKILEMIREIYGLVSSLLLPNAVIPGLKSKIDYLRAILISSEEMFLRLKKEYEFSNEK